MTFISPEPINPTNQEVVPQELSFPAAVVIGASAGAIEALLNILPQLPANYPIPVIIVVHVPPDKKSNLASVFNPRCLIKVKEAEDKEPIEAGTAYFAPPDYHLMIEPDFRFTLSSEEPVLYSRPSIDVLFESAADAYGDTLVAVVLTGANHDGSAGLKAVGMAGGRCIVQSPSSAESCTMPQAALDAWPASQSAPLDEMAQVLAITNLKALT